MRVDVAGSRINPGILRRALTLLPFVVFLLVITVASRFVVELGY